MRLDLYSKRSVAMRDSAEYEPWNSDDLTWRGHTPEALNERMSAMRRELGRRDSPAFEQLRNYLSAPSDIPASVVVEIADMHRARCFADSQSFRQMRGPILWSELHWLPEQTLIDAFTLMWTPKYYQWWRTGPVVRHPNAGPALWMQVVSHTLDTMT
jgi:hypothetical protein